MYVLISYRDTARAAEAEFARLVEDPVRAIGHRLALANANTDGWSRPLPGLVFDLNLNMIGEDSPAVFIGLLDDQFLVACKLLELPSRPDQTFIEKLLKEQCMSYDIIPRFRNEMNIRKNALMQIADGSISVMRIASRVALPYRLSAFGRVVGASGQDATAASILQLADRIGGSGASNHHLSTAISLLLDSFSGESSKTMLRKLVRDHDCRFAWSCIRLDQAPHDEPVWTDRAPVLQGPSSGNTDNPTGDYSTLKSFCEAGGASLWPSSLLYSPFVEQVSRRAWPPWLRFLIS